MKPRANPPPRRVYLRQYMPPLDQIDPYWYSVPTDAPCFCYELVSTPTRRRAKRKAKK